MSRAFRVLTVVTTVATLGLMLLGGYVKATGAGLACPDWPQCFGTWYPFGGRSHGLAPDASDPAFNGFTLEQVRSEWTHRLVAAIVGPMIMAVAAMAWMQRPRDLRAAVASTTSLFLIPLQFVMGGVTVTSFLEPLIVVSHLGLATLIFAGLVMTTVFAFYPVRPARPDGAREPAPVTTGGAAIATNGETVNVGGASAVGASRPLSALAADYLELVKPGILFLLLVAAAASLFLAPGKLTFGVAMAVLIGGAMSASAAATFNHVLERDRDAQMARTRDRPVASSRVPKTHAFVFASVLAVLSVLVMGFGANWLAAGLSFAGLLFYVFVYTLWLKPRTPQNIVIGGAAGAFPALAGWAAVTGDLAWAAVVLGLLVFLWTPPHFWALAIVYKEDYAKAGFPMHPVVHGERSTKIQMLVYAVLTVIASLLLVWPFPVLGAVYLVAAVALGVPFVVYAWQALRTESRAPSRKLFWYSIVYLTALYFAMGADVVAQRFF